MYTVEWIFCDFRFYSFAKNVQNLEISHIFEGRKFLPSSPPFFNFGGGEGRENSTTPLCPLWINPYSVIGSGFGKYKKNDPQYSVLIMIIRPFYTGCNNLILAYFIRGYLHNTYLIYKKKIILFTENFIKYRIFAFKYVHVWCNFSVSHTRSVSQEYILVWLNTGPGPKVRFFRLDPDSI